jgi:biopolymer transport protein ExbD
MEMGHGDGQSCSEINMTPLIDVMLVLLVIFIITLPVQTHAIKLNNPFPGNPPPVVPNVIDLAIDFDGTLLWNGQLIDRVTLQTYISRTASMNPPPEVHIRVDRFAKYEIVAQTLGDLQYRGLERIGFINRD